MSSPITSNSNDLFPLARHMTPLAYPPEGSIFSSLEKIVNCIKENPQIQSSHFDECIKERPSVEQSGDVALVKLAFKISKELSQREKIDGTILSTIEQRSILISYGYPDPSSCNTVYDCCAYL